MNELLDCGCVVVTTATDNLICLCPMHDAAPELLAVLEMIRRTSRSDGWVYLIPDEWARLDLAVARARATAPGSGEGQPESRKDRT